jgi:hypothetical protein
MLTWLICYSVARFGRRETMVYRRWKNLWDFVSLITSAPPNWIGMRGRRGKGKLMFDHPSAQPN